MNLAHWEAYYRGGAIVSCPTNTEPNYSHEVREAWTDFFGHLSDGARILDVGCGNGPLALIAKETAANLSRHFEIDAIDLADIDPRNNVPNGAVLFAGIRFQSEVPTEKLPFDDACMDAVCGQYILEYTNVSETLAEIFRVLTPGGLCQLILHHGDSVVVRNARESLRQADLALHEAKVLRRFRRYCETPENSPAKASRARHDLLEVGSRLKRAEQESDNPIFLEYVINSINALLQHKSNMSRGELLKQTNRLERELNNWTSRLKDLVAGARSDDDMVEIVAAAKKHGLEVASLDCQYQQGDHLIGWRLSMRRSA